ncbi:MAG: hypothetical protein ACOVRN_01870 [Flavobacterium sp.]
MTEITKTSYADYAAVPRIDLISKMDDDVLRFTLSNVDKCVANALRRTMLADIPAIVFRVSPYDQNKCTIHTNTCGLNNEVVKDRLSCVPIHIKDVEGFPRNNYVMEVNVQNNSDTTLYVTSKDFVIKEVATGKPMPEDQLRQIFPANPITGDHLLFVRLKPKAADELHAKSIHLTCEFDVGTAKENGAFSVVSTCSYGNTQDPVAQEAKLQQLKQKWKDEGKTEPEIEFDTANWKLLEAKRIYKKDSFDFILQTVGIHTNVELMILACEHMMKRLDQLVTQIEEERLEIRLADSTIPDCYDIILENEDYTAGNILEHFLLTTMFPKAITYCGFKMLHPHDSYGLLRLAYRNTVVVDTVHNDLKTNLGLAIETFKSIRKEFSKLSR